jgi:hypothetical protein
VEREGPQTEEGATGIPPRDNVVRLPRDWLGPREELVPFGAAANADRAGRRTPRSGPASGEIDEPASRGIDEASRGIDEPAIPPSASDFWGEHSAAIQDVLQGPPPVVGDRLDARVESSEQSRASATRSAGRARPAALRRWGASAGSSGHWRRWAHDAEDPPGTDAGPRPAWRVATVRRPRSRTISMIVIGATLTACVVLVLRTLNAAPSGRVRGASSASRSGGTSPAKATGLQLRLGQLLSSAGEHRPTPRGRSHRHRHATRRRVDAGRAVAAKAKTNPAPQSTPVTAAPGRTTTSDSAPSPSYTRPAENTGSSVPSAPSTSSTSSSGGSGASQSAPAGPTGPGAPFGPGHLG